MKIRMAAFAACAMLICFCAGARGEPKVTIHITSRLKPVYEAYQRAKDKAAFRSSHEAELVIFEAARSTLLAIQGDVKLPSLKLLKAEQEQLTQEQQRLYEERANLKKQAKQIDTIRANVISYLNLSPENKRHKKTKTLSVNEKNRDLSRICYSANSCSFLLAKYYAFA